MAWDDTQGEEDCISYTEWNNMVSFIKAGPISSNAKVGYDFAINSGNNYTSAYNWFSNSSSKLSAISGSLSDRIDAIDSLTGTTVSSNFFLVGSGNSLWDWMTNSGSKYTNIYESGSNYSDAYSWFSESAQKLSEISGSLSTRIDAIDSITGDTISSNFFLKTSGNTLWYWYSNSSSKLSASSQIAMYKIEHGITNWDSTEFLNSGILWNGTEWEAMPSGGSGGGDSPWNNRTGGIYYANEVSLGSSGFDIGDYKLQVSGNTYFSGSVTFIGELSGLADPTYNSGAANKHYVDVISSNLSTRIDDIGGLTGDTISSNFFLKSSGQTLWDWYEISSSKLSALSGSLSDRIDALGSFDPENYIYSTTAITRFADSSNIQTKFLHSGLTLNAISSNTIWAGTGYISAQTGIYAYFISASESNLTGIGISEISEDNSPELGGDLDATSTYGINNLTYVSTQRIFGGIGKFNTLNICASSTGGGIRLYPPSHETASVSIIFYDTVMPSANNYHRLGKINAHGSGTGVECNEIAFYTTDSNGEMQNSWKMLCNEDNPAGDIAPLILTGAPGISRTSAGQINLGKGVLGADASDVSVHKNLKVSGNINHAVKNEVSIGDQYLKINSTEINGDTGIYFWNNNDSKFNILKLDKYGFLGTGDDGFYMDNHFYVDGDFQLSGSISSQKGIYVDWVSGNSTNLVGASNYLVDNADDTTTGTLTAKSFVGPISSTAISSASLKLGTTRITDILDEDDMSSDSDTALATQQSIKKYVDDNAVGGGEGGYPSGPVGSIQYKSGSSSHGGDSNLIWDCKNKTLSISGGVSISGSLGIGTTNPTYDFHVEGNGTTDIQLESDAADVLIHMAGNRGQFGFDNGNSEVGIQGGSGKSFFVGTNSSTFGENKRFYIDSNGNVGINENTPSHLLNVKGSISSQSISSNRIWTAGYISSQEGLYTNFISANHSNITGQWSTRTDGIYYEDEVTIGHSNFDFGDYKLLISGSSFFSGATTFVGELSGLADPTYNSGAANKHYVDVRPPTSTEPNKTIGTLWMSGNSSYARLYMISGDTNPKWMQIAFT